MKMNIWFDIVCDKFIIVEIEILICIRQKIQCILMIKKNDKVIIIVIVYTA